MPAKKYSFNAEPKLKRLPAPNGLFLFIAYILIFKVFFPKFGHFILGRCVDLAQLDLIALLLLCILIVLIVIARNIHWQTKRLIKKDQGL